tara:strand:+ start:1399 stop:2112 length:714 start_codon:yes stop_codon:yes gene_type:complete
MTNWYKYLTPYFLDPLSKKLRPILGFTPKNIRFYYQAFSHSSIDDKKYGNNERLEFLGDSILDSIITEYLFTKLPDKKEGTMTDIRSKMVSRKSLNKLGEKIHLDQFIQCNLNGKTPESIYGNTFEALIAAIYLDKGRKHCEKFVIQKIIEPSFCLKRLEIQIVSYKKHFINWAQKNSISYSFTILSEEGESHKKKFKVGLYIEEKIITESYGLSKKKAEESSAKIACKLLKIPITV